MSCEILIYNSFIACIYCIYCIRRHRSILINTWMLLHSGNAVATDLLGIALHIFLYKSILCSICRSHDLPIFFKRNILFRHIMSQLVGILVNCRRKAEIIINVKRINDDLIFCKQLIYFCKISVSFINDILRNTISLSPYMHPLLLMLYYLHAAAIHVLQVLNISRTHLADDIIFIHPVKLIEFIL